MKALVLSEYNKLQVTDVEDPVPGPDELLIQVAACGICGSDVHGFDGSSGRRKPPIVMGHEAAGTVVAAGSLVTDFSPGDRVAIDSTVFCGGCRYCLSGDINLCESRQVLGVSCDEYRRTGAFAQLVTVPSRIAYRLPDSLSFAEAAMLEAVAVALHAVAVSEMRETETVLVLGAGMIGLLVMQAAKAKGPASSDVLVADIDQTRLNLAAELGASQTICLSGDELIAAVLERTGGCGVDHVFEAVGLNVTISTAIECVRRGGTITLVGNIAPQVDLPLQKIVSRQIRLQGSCASAGEYQAAIQLIGDGKIKVKPLITAVGTLEEGPAWFHRLHAREHNLIKVILDPRSAATQERPVAAR